MTMPGSSASYASRGDEDAPPGPGAERLPAVSSNQSTRSEEMSETDNAYRVTRVYPANDAEGWTEALWALRTGEVVVFPTDTVYGVGCDLWQPEAVARLYWAKQRPERLPIPILVSAPEHALLVADRAQLGPRVAARLAALCERFWPGELTVILPRRSYVPDIVCAGGPTIAVRMPDHPIALRLIAEMGGALAATSANTSGAPAAVTAAQALADLDGRVAVLLDGGPCPGGVASSIVDLVSETPVLLRQGGLELDTLRQVLPDLIVPHTA
ncbi:MAG: threonylcarbamoyl-AMP synthase [Chloroflexi bacterium]|nr:threonylcarbamoyl-AMP synthase [Chloroflexota bacterium]